MAVPGDKDLTLTIHGLEHMGRSVYADEVARQIRAFLGGLEGLDNELNSKGARHEFVVADMHIGSAVFAVRELPSKRATAQSPCRVYASAGRQIALGSATKAIVPDPVAKSYGALTKNAGERFRYSILEDDKAPENIFRLDREFKKKLAVLSGAAKAPKAKPEFFVGHTWGSFEGAVLELDARLKESLLPAGHFVLSAGSQDIECIFYLDLDELDGLFRKRVIVEGNAIYDGLSGLPSRIEIYKVRPVVASPTGFLERPAVPDFDLEDME